MILKNYKTTSATRNLHRSTLSLMEQQIFHFHNSCDVHVTMMTGVLTVLEKRRASVIFT